MSAFAVAFRWLRYEGRAVRPGDWNHMSHRGWKGITAVAHMALILGGAILQAALAAPAESGAAATAAPVHKIPHEAGQPVAVTVYEFRSGAAEIPARASTDLFITALVQNKAFRVVERAQLNQGVVPEKQLNAQQLTSGTGASQKLRAADYIFEGTISEANASAAQSQGALGVAGMTVSRGTNVDVIAVDVRIVDAATGDVLDVVTVRTTVKSSSSGVSGVGSLLGSFLAKKAIDTTYTPDANIQNQHKESLDEALRNVITQAVTQLAARF